MTNDSNQLHLSLSGTDSMRQQKRNIWNVSICDAIFFFSNSSLFIFGGLLSLVYILSCSIQWVTLTRVLDNNDDYYCCIWERKLSTRCLTIKENSNHLFVIDKWTDDGMYRMLERERVHTINDEEYISTFQ